MINQIFEQIKLAKKVLIISHVNPDGDTLGSMCAMKLFIGDKADMLIQTPKGGCPETYKFLPNISKAKTLENVQNIYDLIIAVDIAAVDRIVQDARKIFDKTEKTINIDHHKTNRGYAKLNHIDPKASSCGEVLFDMFENQNIKISKEIADCLYVSILTDTGSFRYDTTSAKTFEIASKLVQMGTNSADIAQKCYDNKPKAMVMFQADCLCRAQFACENKIAYTTIHLKDMEKFAAKDEHTEGISESLRSLDTTEISFVVKETPEGFSKVSMRSKAVDVTKIVEKFGGGGHIRAAGCTIRKQPETAAKMLIQEAQQYI